MKTMTKTSVFTGKKIRSFFLLITALALAPILAYSTHIVGGELNYKCLGGNKYEIHLRVYRDCYTGVPPFDANASIGIFNSSNVRVATLSIPYPGKTVLSPTIAQADVCVKIPSNVCVEVCEYVGTIVLPPIAGGYQLAYQRCCRNPTISNITNPGNTGATYYAHIPDQAVACNSNPVFKNWPPIFVCVGNPILFDHSATDEDGDSIVYNLCTPLHGATASVPMPQPPNTPPYTAITWRAPYGATDPLGGIPLTIDPKTGSLTGTPNTIGQFVVGVCADEYRNGVLISTTKRDFQFNVIKCLPSIVVAAPSVSVNCTNHTATFTNNSTGGTSYYWNFGDTTVTNDTSNVLHPSYTYPGVGTYLVTLIARSNISDDCNDTLRNFVVKIDTCAPCAMTLANTKVDAVCGTISTADTVLAYSNGGVPYPPNPCAGTGHADVNAGQFPSQYTIGKWYWICDGVDTVLAWNNGSTLYPPNPCTGGKYWFNTKDSKYYWVCPGSTGTGSPGSSTVSPLGGTAPYTYSWSTGQTGATATNLSAGTYTITVIDANGCQKTTTETIDANSNITLTTGQTPLSACGAADATGIVTPTGGTGPFTYAWSTTPAQTDSIATGLTAGTHTVTVTDSKGCFKSVIVTIAQPVIIIVSATKTDVVCKGVNNGTATVPLPTTGTGPYTYSWSTNPVQSTPTATGLPTGYYVVTVMDVNGCVGSSSVTIADSPMLLTSASTDPACHGSAAGTATINANGGTPNYTYSWSDSGAQTTATASGLTAGTYIGKVVDAAGCTDSVTVTITEPPLLVPEATNTSTTSCTGVPTGSAHVDVSGGTAPFTYSWCNSQTTPDVSGLAAGLCAIMVTDSKGCSKTDTINIVPPPPITISTLNTNLSCNGDKNGAATVSPFGGAPAYTYLWSTTPAETTQTADSLAGGIYSVTVTDAQGCTAVTIVTIIQPAALNTLNSVTPECNSTISTARLTVTGGTLGYSYLWSTSPAQTDSVATGLTTGVYVATITDSKGCTDTAMVTVAGNNPNVVADYTIAYQYSCNAGVMATFTNTSTGATSWLWNFGDGTTSTLKDPTHKFNYNQTYKVTLVATGALGCTDTMSTTISINPFNDYLNLIVPNVFTPNGDGRNDCFQISVGNNLEPCVQLTIFDRWGLKMYDNENGLCWDGNGPSGKECPDGTYFYLVKVSDKGLHGSLTLIR